MDEKFYILLNLNFLSELVMMNSKNMSKVRGLYINVYKGLEK